MSRDAVLRLAPVDAVPEERPDLRAAVARAVTTRSSPPAGARLIGKVDVLDHVDVDGRRYFLVCVAEPRVDDTLTPREDEVTRRAAAGSDPKVIAYDLGLAHSTVRVLLARAARKLGARTWQELVAVYEARRA